MKLILKLFLVFCLLNSMFCSNLTEPPRMEWGAADLGQVTKAFDDRVKSQLLIEDLHQENVPRLYCLVNNLPFYSQIYEFNYGSDGWSKTRIDRDGLNISVLAVGHCRHDGKLRLYGASTNNIYELTYVNGQWNIEEIFKIKEAPPTSYTRRKLAIGDVRNEGFESLYFFKRLESDSLFELSFRNLNWEIQFIDTLAYMEDIAVGDGRGRGIENIYITDRNSMVFEYDFLNGDFNKSELGTFLSLPPNTHAYSIIDVNNAHEGQSAVYPSWSITGGEAYEYYYNGNQWIKTQVCSEPGINCICGGIGRNDGMMRLYFSGDFDKLSEYTFDGGGWAKTAELNTDAETALFGLAVGPGRGDGINRVYVVQFIGHLLEFTYHGK